MTDKPAPGADVARPANRWTWTAPCGDRVVRDGNTLVVYAALPIAELVEAKYRRSVLVFRRRRFLLERIEGDAQRPVYRFVEEVDNLYESGGVEVEYDPDRHEERRRERRQIALGYLLWLPTVPLLPLIGLLPEEWKQKLVRLGVDPGRATRLSLVIEWLVLLCAAIVYPFAGGILTVPGAIVGFIALYTALDIAYRVSSDYDGRAPAAFSVGRPVVDWLVLLVKTARGKDRLPGTTEDEAPKRREP